MPSQAIGSAAAIPAAPGTSAAVTQTADTPAEAEGFDWALAGAGVVVALGLVTAGGAWIARRSAS